MYLPKFNLSKLRQSVANQQNVTKKDIANLLLLDRLQSQVEQVKGDDLFYSFGFKPSGKRYTKKDKKNLKKNPYALFYNVYVDSIIENESEIAMSTQWDSNPSISIHRGELKSDEAIFKQFQLPPDIDLKDIGGYFISNVSSKLKNIHILTGDYSEVFYSVDNINNRMNIVEADLGSPYINILSTNTVSVYILKNEALNTKVDFLKNSTKQFHIICCRS